MSPYEADGASAAVAAKTHITPGDVAVVAAPLVQRTTRSSRAQANGVSTDETPTAFAELANSLANALMLGVQRVAELNINTTRALLGQAGSVSNARLDGTAEAWRFSWRSYEVCSTTAATILKLCQFQARTSFDDLWRALEDGLAQMPYVDLQRVRDARVAFEAMHTAYSSYFDAALVTHRALLALAAGAR